MERKLKFSNFGFQILVACDINKQTKNSETLSLIESSGADKFLISS